MIENNFCLIKYLNTGITLLAVFIIQINSVIGQSFADNLTQIREIPTTPTMWEFQKYGDYPVSMHTGVPEIAIPLMNAKSGKLSIPISLSYHASGIKVNQKASWVGLGWSLMAGGAITRTVRGSHDEQGGNGYLNYPFYDEGSFDPALDPNYVRAEDMMTGVIDTEPDIFQYNFMGYSGRFLFDNDGTIASIPHNDLKIEAVFSGSDIIEFKITTPEGYTAEFAYREFSSVNRPTRSGTLFLTAPTTWHLKTVTAPNNIDKIIFEYKDIGSFVDERFSESETIILDPCDPGTIVSNSPGNFSNNGVFFSQVKRLEKITFSNGFILFESSTGNRLDDASDEDLRLDRITLYNTKNGVDTPIKGFDFQYGYFGSIDPNNDIADSYAVRLKLSRVTEIGEEGGSKNPYKFSYIENIGNLGMPGRFSNAQDYWGYFNGINNSTLIPRYDYMLDVSRNRRWRFGGASREVSPKYAKIGIIQKITYPTLGYSKFEFESNDAIVMEEGANPVEHLSGGLRVKTIFNHHFDNSLQWQKSYEYTQPENPNSSSGVYNGNAYVSPRDYLSYRDNYFTTTERIGTCPPCSNLGCPDYIQGSVSMSTSPTSSKNFATVFYATVKEYNGSILNHKGYKWYHYDTTKDYQVTVTGPAFFTIDRSWDRGQLRLEETFKNDESTPIESTSYIYEKATVRPPIKGFKPGTFFDVKDLTYSPYNSTLYNFRKKRYFLGYYEEPIIWKRLKSKIITKDGLTTQEDYSYDIDLDHTSPIKITFEDSKGTFINSRSYYPDDITDPSVLEGGELSPEVMGAIEKLKSTGLNFRTGQLIQKTSTQNDNVQIERYNFTDWGGNIIRPNSIETSKFLSSETSILEKRAEFTRYDDRGNPLEVLKSNGIITSYIWGYDKQLPIAKIENASYDDIANEIGISTTELLAFDEQDLSTLNNLRTNWSKTMITTFEYRPLIGVTRITDPRGYAMNYVYDEFHRLKEVHDDKGNIVKDYKYNYAIEQ